jgi:hypothetical protein
LTIESYAFDNANINYLAVFGPVDGTTLEDSSNVDTVIEQVDTPAGEYSATNSFGVKARVEKVHRNTNAIFDRQGELGIRDGLFGMPNRDWMSFPLTPVAAQVVKPKLRIAFAVVPKAPYLLKGEGHSGRPTIDRPVDVEETVTLLVGDIQCALLMDNTNKVLGSFPTQ